VVRQNSPNSGWRGTQTRADKTSLEKGKRGMEMKTWFWFKELVKELRKYNDELIKKQEGRNQIMISVGLFCHDDDVRDWISLNPHSINLHTGKTRALVNGIYREIDAKWLFYMKSLGDPKK
jgi:hypothetical protein